MIGAVEIEVCGERVWLMPQRGVYWHARRMLMVADLHLGKADAARAEGAPLSGHVLRAMLEKHLARLSEAIEACGAERVVVLGDLLHAPAGITAELVEGVSAWRETVAAAIDVVPGNHDRRVERVAAEWKMGVLESRVRVGAFELVHDPAGASGEAFAWCGHLHPAVNLARGGDAMRLPAFHVGTRVGVLPAFTSMASGRQMAIEEADRLFAAAPGAVVEVKERCVARSGR